MSVCKKFPQKYRLSVKADTYLYLIYQRHNGAK